MLSKGPPIAIVMSQYCAFKGAPNSISNVKFLAFQEAANNNCNVVITLLSKGPEQQL